MTSNSGSHAESQTVWPDPLSGGGPWNLGALALPAVMLSVCSAVVFALVLLFLRAGSGQELFVVRFPGAFVTGAIAAALAWGIAVKGRNRPGRLWPRVWSLTLACVNSTCALLGLVYRDSSWVLAVAVAGLGAAATLAPRFVKLRPDSRMVQWVGPLSLLIILVLILPTSCVVRRTITRNTEQRVEQRIQQFRVWAGEVRETTGFEWRRMEDSPESAGNAVAALKQLHFRGSVNDPEVWHSAVVLGRDDELAAAMQALATEVVAALAPERVPRVSDLREAAIRWDAQAGRWESYSQFARLSEVTGSYHEELGRLFAELEPQDASAGSARFAESREHYARQRSVLRDHLNAVATTWADNWAVYRVPNHGELIGREHPPLRDVLRAKFIEDQEASLAPGQLWQLTVLPLQRLQEMAQGAPGCEGGDGTELSASPPRRARGCQCQSYDEKRKEYFRLDCYSYSPRTGGTGAELRVEMRLVYQSAIDRRLARSSLPVEIFFHFLIPGDAKVEEFREEVMTSLAAAAREYRHDETVAELDRGGSAAGGFRIDDGRDAVRVSASVVPLIGLTPESQALRVRAVRTPSRRSLLTGG